MKDLEQKIEAVLFVAGEAVSLKRLEAVLRAEKEEIEAALGALRESLEGRGIRLVEKDGEYMLATAPEGAGAVQEFTKEELGEGLSKAALETLSVVAYKGPISRAEIDYIRGVNSSFTLRSLLIRGLIERKADAKDSRAFFYEPSFDFLQFIGLDRLENLPQYEEFRREVNELQKAKGQKEE
ncbi:MAG: SMC-Scp complex subunit ScpB [Patescibacteria group bacterium]